MTSAAGPDRSAGGGRLVYQPVPGRIGALLVAAFAAWWAVAAMLQGAGHAARTIPWLVAFTLLVWVVFWRPAVVVDDDAVLLRNPIRDVRVPWAALEGVDTRFALTLLVGEHRYASWAAAAPGRPAPMLRGPRESGAPPGQQLAAPVRPGVVGHRSSRAITADSGAAAFLVEQRWEARREHVDLSDQEVTVRRHLGLASAIALAVLVGALAALLG